MQGESTGERVWFVTGISRGLGAVIAMSEALAAEVEPLGIGVTVVSPARARSGAPARPPRAGRPTSTAGSASRC